MLPRNRTQPHMKNITRLICRNSPTWSLLRYGGLLVASLALFVTAHAQPAATGGISGVVSNAKTNVNLEGAIVSLSGPGGVVQTATTERGGTFSFFRVPAGHYTVQATYTGLDNQSKPVDVQAGVTTSVAMGLTSAIYTLNAFTVEGQREGNAAAITQQHNAANIVDVLSMDAYGDVADGNIAIMIQNEPGVAVFQQSGDDTGISVGGVPVELTSINIDGSRMASAIVGSTAGIGDRGQLIDRIPADFISKIEVTMGNMPDQMADSLAGSVNLVTKSGFDVSDPVFEYRVGLTNNNYFDSMKHKFRPTGEFSWLGTIDKRRKLALSLNASYSDTLNPSENINTSHSNVTDARASGARELLDLNDRLREGVNGKLEYKFADDTARVWLGGTIDYYTFTNDRINWQASAGNQNFADFSVVSLAAIQGGAAPKTTAGAAAGLAPGYDPNAESQLLNPTVTNDAEHEDRRGHQYTLEGGVTKEWNGGDSKATVTASWNPTSFDDDFYGITVNYNNMPVGVLVDERHDAMRPIYSQTYGPSLAAGHTTYGAPWFANWFAQPDIERQTLSDVRGDFEQKVEIGGLPNTFKTGVEYRDENNWFINTYRPFWNFTGNVGTYIPQILEPAGASHSVFNDSMPSFRWDTIDFNKAKSLFYQSPQLWAPQGTTVSTHPVPRQLAEFVNAAYIQDSIQIGKLNVLGGVRFEHTAIEGVGSYSDSNLPNVTRTHISSAYQNSFPSIHLKYDVNRHLVFKASYSTSSARPSYSSIVPNTTVNNTPTTTGQPGSVSQGNPGLHPDYGRSLEGAAEYYFEPAGVLSFSYFYRKLSNFIFNTSSIIGTGPNNGFNGLYAGYNLSTTSNLSEAYDEGYELNYKEQFRFLPKPFNGLSVFADTTIQKTHGLFSSGASMLPFFTPRTSNAGVVFDYKRFEARFTWHDHSYYLQSFSTNPASNTYVGDIPQEDLGFTYRINPHYTLFVDAVNIRDKDYIQYNVNIYTRNTEVQDNGRRVNFGVSGRF